MQLHGIRWIETTNGSSQYIENTIEAYVVFGVVGLVIASRIFKYNVRRRHKRRANFALNETISCIIIFGIDRMCVRCERIEWMSTKHTNEMPIENESVSRIVVGGMGDDRAIWQGNWNEELCTGWMV